MEADKQVAHSVAFGAQISKARRCRGETRSNGKNYEAVSVRAATLSWQ
eukprot:CAMPEP_0206530456 /NCGR_PEP_ID=MMETSP0325_2-20121206/3187_1 /ASSEMBLY_ACC=CAM_ASM_000347 /TAXON_ID=2866 /ORGANISM="Crypthecodinium cohnii, Strain Seligo" /LENGTH=47 /DNA_ID= /DNA_START= /DNA_END= /DNA_ORIENTATION=